MGNPAARILDLHVCPLLTAGIAHVGGPVLPPGEPTVLIGKIPAARLGDQLACIGPPDTIVGASATVMIGKAYAARLGDPTAHGGAVVAGCPTVLIG